MTLIPWREAAPRTAQQRDERAAQLRRLLGPVEGWPEDWRLEWLERRAIVEEGSLKRSAAEHEVTDALRAELLGRLP